MSILRNVRNFAARNGKMAERSNAAVLKTVDLRGSGGSNPSLSAGCKKRVVNFRLAAFFVSDLLNVGTVK